MPASDYLGPGHYYALKLKAPHVTTKNPLRLTLTPEVGHLFSQSPAKELQIIIERNS